MRWKRKSKVAKRFLYLWNPHFPLLLRERWRCTHSAGWRLKGGWPRAPWWQRAEARSGARGSAGFGLHRPEPKRGPFQGLRAGLPGVRVQPWWRAGRWLEILQRVRKMAIATAVIATHIPAFGLTWSTLGVPVLWYRCYMVGQLLVVVMRDRRTLPAQTFRGLQTARRRRKKSLMCWRCRGAPVEEEDKVVQQNHSIPYFILIILAIFLTASTCVYVLPSSVNLLCSIQPNESKEQREERVKVWQRLTCPAEHAGNPLTWRTGVRTASWSKPPLAAVFSWRLVPPVCSQKRNPDAKSSLFQARLESGPLLESSGWERGCV